MERQVNMRSGERWLALIGGGLLLTIGLVRSLKNVVWFLLGGMLAAWGLSGRLPMRDRLRRGEASPRSSRSTLLGEARPLELSHTLTVAKSPADVYQFWRSPENVARYISAVESVREEEGGKVVWTLGSPMRGGMTMDWTTRVANDRENELIAWTSADGGMELTLAAEFHEAPADRGTEMRVVLVYVPPRSAIGVATAAIARPILDRQLRSDLRRIKAAIEAGETPTVASQPAGGPPRQEEEAGTLKQLVAGAARRMRP